MAERRMFAKTIVTSDAFLDMPSSARCLYFMLAMMADDDGFVNNPSTVMRMSGASGDDMKLLIAKRFVLTFESGVVVIKHWCIHNTIQKDRYKETKYIEEKATLSIDKHNGYTEIVPTLDTTCIQSVSETDTQVRLGEDRLVKDKDIESVTDTNAGHKPTRHKYGQYKNVLLTDEELSTLKAEFPNDLSERIERLSEYIASSGKRYKSHFATIRSWARKDKKMDSRKGGNIFLEIAQEEGII